MTRHNRPPAPARRPPGTTRTCGGPGCFREISLGHFVCFEHWKRLTRDLQDQLTAAYQAYQANPQTENLRKLRDAQFAAERFLVQTVADNRG